MKSAKVQSISDLITNSSSEAFVVYDKGNIRDIKDLVDTILSLIDPSKTFDDYFTIEMLINYEDLQCIFEKYHENDEYYEDIPELKSYNEMSSEEALKFIESLPLKRVAEIIDWANGGAWDRHYRLYEGFAVNTKDGADPVTQRAAIVLNSIDNIFDVDCFVDY